MSGAGLGPLSLNELLGGPDAALPGVLADLELYLPDAFDTLYTSEEPSCGEALVFSISSALARAVSSARAD